MAKSEVKTTRLYSGTKQARRILPGDTVEVAWPGLKSGPIQDLVESVHISARFVNIVTVSGYRLQCKWDKRFNITAPIR